ncbi:MAG TPA: hypothetical protein PK323_09130 [Bacteroidia bacterium]|nr:hypothetical protein [Bacteroidia bacterium]
MKKANLLPIVFLLNIIVFGIFSCKKDSSLEQTSVLPKGNLSNNQAKPSALITTDVQTYYIDNPIQFLNGTASPTKEVEYAWYEINSSNENLIGNTKEIDPRVYTAPDTVWVKLIAMNKFGADTFIKEIIIKDKPKSANITSISLDSVNYINPITNANWNPSGGPNVLYRFYDVNQVWIDSTVRSANNNLYGWASAFNSTQSALLTLNDVNSTPISWYYPTGIKFIQFSKMLNVTTLKIYNQHAINGLEVIAEIPFVFIDYFRTDGNTTDVSTVKLRSADGKTVLTVKIKYNT